MEWRRVGGVFEPEFRVEEDLAAARVPLVVPLVVPLLESVDRSVLSVLKLALERLRMSLRKAGAMTHCRMAKEVRRESQWKSPSLRSN